MKSRLNNIENEHNYFMARSVRVPRRDTSEMRDDKSNYLDKQLEAEKRSKVYSTEIINKLLSDDYDGKGDMMPFFHGKTEWRNADITFEYTAEEWQELQKCAEEPLYFVRNILSSSDKIPACRYPDNHNFSARSAHRPP